MKVHLIRKETIEHFASKMPEADLHFGNG